jgi:hypothetical protein
MARRLPRAVQVIAILHLVFGGLRLFCALTGGLMKLAGAPKALPQTGGTPQQQDLAQQERRKEITEQVNANRIPLYRAYTITNQVLSVLYSMVLLASGVGLLTLRSWARWLSVGYAACNLMGNLCVFGYTIAFFIPAQNDAFRQLPPQSEEERLAYNMATVLAPGTPCVMMTYPAAVLIVLLLPSVGAAFRPRKQRRRRGDPMEEVRDRDRAASRERPPYGGRFITDQWPRPTDEQDAP